MKLEKVLNNLNSLEKNSFIKAIDGILAKGPKNQKEVDKIISESDKSDIKNLDNILISKIFTLVEDEFSDLIRAEFVNTSSQLDILTDIIVRDGNCIMKQEWFLKLYETELKGITKKVKELQKELENPKSEISESRKRDYRVYKACVDTSYNNDIENNRDAKITDDELSILLTLSNSLELSQEEVKLINYMVVPAKVQDIDDVISDLRNLGVIFFSKKSRTVFVADEMVRVLRKVREKDVADKFFRRVLRTLREPQINLICKKHNIDRKLGVDKKIKEIINEGLSFRGVLMNDVHKEGTTVSDKKKFVNELWTKGLHMPKALKGTTLEDKIDNVIAYFEEIEKDEKVGISVDGYEKLITDLGSILPKLNNLLKSEFELQDDDVLNSGLLLNYNIKPRDVLDILPQEQVSVFCDKQGVKKRGDDIQNILEAYKDSENLYLENYSSISFRDLNTLKENGIQVKESELGVRFEELTRSIFEQLGFNVDESLKRSLNTKKDKIDIVLNLGENQLILIECKTNKESGFNKFSSVSRQMGAYVKLAKANDYQVVKSLLVAPEFSDEFISDTEMEFDLNLSLIKADSLYKILEAFKGAKKHNSFPYKLLLKDVLIDEARIIKAINK